MDFFNSYERKYEEVKENLIETPLSNNSFPQCLNDLEFSTYPTEQELKTRYRELAKKYHPDKGGNAKDFEKISFSCKNSIVINEKVIINSKIHLKSCLRAEKKIHKIIHIILLKT